jgi:hydrogenase maturation factor
MIEMNVVISANSTTGDYKNAFLVSAGTMKGSGILIAPNATAVAGTTAYNVNAANITTAIAIGTNAADIDLLASIKIIFSFTASANATFKYQFAQNNAIAATTARTFKGSILKYKKIN